MFWKQLSAMMTFQLGGIPIVVKAKQSSVEFIEQLSAQYYLTNGADKVHGMPRLAESEDNSTFNWMSFDEKNMQVCDYIYQR